MPSRVYVVELERGAGPRRDQRIPWVYVGSSARDAETRFAQHLRGYKSSGLVKRRARRLRPDLYGDLPAFRSSRRAQEAEVARAHELAGAGFVAHSDGTSYGRGSAAWEEWGPERLEPVIAHLDRAIATLAESSFAALDAETCGRLLHGERGFWVSECLDPDDPPPAYGMFSHVRLNVLEARAAIRLADSPVVAR